MSAQPVSRQAELAEITQLDRRKSVASTITPRGQIRRSQYGVIVVEHQESSPSMLWQSTIQPLMARCSLTHQAITTDSDVLGGIPHIAGTRLSVGQVLGRLHVHGSIGEVVTYYSGQVNAEQVREAIAYAQDFIEAVCEPPEANG